MQTANRGSAAAPAPVRLSAEERAFLGRVSANLPLLADLLHADLLLYTRDGHEVAVFAHAQPHPLPSLYAAPQTGRHINARENAVGALLILGRSRSGIDGLLVRGAPAVQELYPVCRDGHLVGALSVETNLLEYERMRRKDSVLRRALTGLRQAVLAGELHGGDRLGRLGEHDGLLIVDQHGEIEYISTVAENQYRRLGYSESLLHGQLSELDTNEYVCFQAMERNVCLERRVEEQGQIWIKRVVPLPPEPPRRWWRADARPAGPSGALIAIQDITDDVRKEQELTIKSAMIQEIHHRVKNNLQTIAALLRMQARRSNDPEVADLLQQTITRILSVAVVHEFLSKEDATITNVNEVCHRIMSEVTAGVLDPSKRISLSYEGTNCYLANQQATSCALIVNELLQNAIEHAFEGRDEGTVQVRLRETPDSMLVEVQDDGTGLPPDFNLEQSPSLGLQIVQTLARDDLKGKFELRCNGGVTAVISIPSWQLREAPRRGEP